MSASLLLLVDGYNVIGPVAGPAGRADPNWLHHERVRLLDRLADQLSVDVRRRSCVVFDAANPPPDRPSRFRYRDIDVRFAVDHSEADDLLEEIIAAHHSPKRLTVVSSDHRIQTAISRRGGRWYDSDPWFDSLLDGKVRLVAWPKKSAQRKAASEDEAPRSDSAIRDAVDAEKQAKRAAGDLPPDEVRRWLEEFDIDPG